MPTFMVLQQQAWLLPEKLSKAYNKHYTLGGIFCSCAPSQVAGDSVITDALLLHHTGKCLEFYPEGNDVKLKALSGMYVYIWQRYGSALQHLINKPFLDLLSDHLEVNSLVALDNTFYKSSLDELDNFCNWVYSNRKFTELEALYHLFPTDMRASIHIQKNQQPTSDISFSNAVTDFMDNVWNNRLF